MAKGRNKPKGHNQIVHEVRKLSNRDNLGNLYVTDDALYAEYCRRHGRVRRDDFNRAIIEIRNE